MRLSRVSLLAAACVSACSFPFVAGCTPANAAPLAAPAVDPQVGHLVTLRCVDDLSATYGFSTAEHGYIVQKGTIRNTISHLSFHRWVKNSLVAGIQGGSRAVIKDIGDVRTRSTDMSVLPFLAREGSMIVDKGTERSSIPDAGIALTDEAASRANASVHLGHVYLLRLDDRDTTHFVALRVVEFTPEQSVTFRWRML